ncbi:hypothetical protein TNCV_4379081 [Trichonephila clavipes]|nr:hypothetical protein TNCV_4379081 [Trichonephila clavipes]
MGELPDLDAFDRGLSWCQAHEAMDPACQCPNLMLDTDFMMMPMAELIFAQSPNGCIITIYLGFEEKTRVVSKMKGTHLLASLIKINITENYQ